MSIYFNRPFTIPEFKTITLKTTDLDQYLGKYSCPTFPLKIVITKRNAMLFEQADGQGAYPLEAQGDNKFTFAPTNATFQFDPAKKTFTVIQNGVTHLFTKID